MCDRISKSRVKEGSAHGDDNRVDSWVPLEWRYFRGHLDLHSESRKDQSAIIGHRR